MQLNEVLAKHKKIAVIGLKNNPNKYVYKIYKRLLEENYEVYGVSEYISELEGVKVYTSLYDIDEKIDIAVFVVGPNKAIHYIEECKSLGINYLWMQPGTYDEDVLNLLETSNLTYYLNCILRRLNDLKNEKNIDKTIIM